MNLFSLEMSYFPVVPIASRFVNRFSPTLRGYFDDRLGPRNTQNTPVTEIRPPCSAEGFSPTELCPPLTERWTEERHSFFLNWIKASFVRQMIAGGGGAFPCRCTEMNGGLRLKRYVPDSTTESTEDEGFKRVESSSTSNIELQLQLELESSSKVELKLDSTGKASSSSYSSSGSSSRLRQCRHQSPVSSSVASICHKTPSNVVVRRQHLSLPSPVSSSSPALVVTVRPPASVAISISRRTHISTSSSTSS
ncbi:hypothetical protein IEQ34_005601 [Dendrobium chrysotoxum]|uniref:Uncharacterized protein n=1 Tax=Dendrobium chrysotoxum TaxID=161865 RepID=A0AAV7HDJ6_DENCH|nr:hypothetical protein IEQ34_005601 [Dendrobium chrysotoxum]